MHEMGITAKQVTISTIFPGAIKAFHKHSIQTDWVACVSGNVKLITFENRDQSIPSSKETISQLTTTCFGEKKPLLVRIAPETYHGYTTIGNEPATIIYITDHVYNPQDEFRLPWDFAGAEIWGIDHK